MSYSLVPYFVDLDQLRRVVGSKDETLIAAVHASDPARFDDAGGENDDGYGEELSLGAALSQLVMGEKLNKSHAHQYGYALERVCEHVGQRLTCNLWCGVRWAAMEDTGVDAILTRSGPPVKLPPIPDFPTIGYLDRQEVRAMVEQMGEEGLGHEDAELRELLKEFEGWLREAAGSGKDLILFYY